MDARAERVIEKVSIVKGECRWRKNSSAVEISASISGIMIDTQYS